MPEVNPPNARGRGVDIRGQLSALLAPGNTWLHSLTMTAGSSPRKHKTLSYIYHLD